MSIIKQIAKLKELSSKVQNLKNGDLKMTDENLRRFNNYYDEIVSLNPNKSKKGLSNHIHGNIDSLIETPSTGKSDVYFQFSERLHSLLENDLTLSTEILLEAKTPPVSPSKSPHHSPTKLKSPSKLPSNKFALSFDRGVVDIKINELEEKSLAGARTEEYFQKVLELDKKIQNKIIDLEKEIEENKTKMKASFKGLMLQNGLPYDEKNSEGLLGELFDIVHNNEGTFEKLVKALSESLAANLKEKNDVLSNSDLAKIILDVRNKIIKVKPNLFQSLGNVSALPECYFDANEMSKNLAHYFTQALYGSPDCVKVMMSFQQEKEKSVKLDLLNRIINAMPALYNQEILFKLTQDDDEQRHYISCIQDLENFSNIHLVPWEDVAEKILLRTMQGDYQGNKLSDEALRLILKEAQKTYNQLAKTYETAKTGSELNSCISFFPIRLELHKEWAPEYICLVTTSGDVQKISKEHKQNKKALKMFQNMIKAFAKELGKQVVDNIAFTFVYHDEEQSAIDVLLQQINKGYSGNTQPLFSYKEDNSAILNDPFRACAEKKFIAYVRDALNDSTQIKSLSILGAANLRMPIIPTFENIRLLTKCIQRLHFAILENKEQKTNQFCTTISDFIENDLELLNSLSSNLGKMYESYLAKNNITIYLKTKKPLKIAQIIADSDYEINCTQVEKNQHLKIFKQLDMLFIELYKFSVNCMMAKKAGKLNDLAFSEMQGSIKIIISNIENTYFLLPRKFDEQKPTYKKTSNSVIHQVSRVCSDKEESFTLLDSLIKKYTLYIASHEESLNPKMPAKFMVKANYGIDIESELETNFIDCCSACQSNKLPVLTWLTDLQLALKAKQQDEFFIQPLLFSHQCHNNSTPKFSIEGAPEFNLVESNHTTLSPLTKSLKIEDGAASLAPETNRPTKQQSTVAKKLFF